MAQNRVSANDILYLLSERLSLVSTLQDLLGAVADYPQNRGASAVIIYGGEPGPRLAPEKLHIIAQWSDGELYSEDAWIQGDFRSNENQFMSDHPIFIPDSTDTKRSPHLNADICRFLATDQYQASVLIPLKVNLNWIGVIHVVWKTTQTFTNDDRRIFTAIGQQTAWVIFGVALHKEIQERTKQTELLLELSTKLSQASDEHEILTAVAAAVMPYGVDVLALSYIDLASLIYPDTITLMAHWTRLVETTTIKRVKLGIARSMPEFLKQYFTGGPSDEPILIEQMSAVTEGHDPAQLERTVFNYETSALIPLWRGSWQGLISINWTSRHTFSEEEKYIYSALIQILAPVVATHRAYLAQQAARQESEQRAKELETVSKVSAAASQNLEINQLLQTVVDLSKSSFNLYNAHLYLLDLQGEYLTLAATSGETGQAMKALGVTRLLLVRDPSIAAQCGHMKAGIIVNDVSKSTDFIPNPLLPDVRSEMAVPMLLGDKLIGVLNLQSTEINRFTANVLLVMQALADEIAVAVRNVQLYEEQFRVAEELRNLDKLKNQFLANMSHELRTPLNAILNFTYFVSSSLFGPVNEKQVDALGKVTSGATHLLGLINDILDFSKIEAGMMQLFWEDVNLNLLLENVIATVNGLPHSEGVKLVTDIDPDLPIIRGDKQRIRQIMLNLLSNSLKFTQEGTITISVYPNETEVLLSVSDTGQGIAQEEQEAVFQAFIQTPEGLGRGGTGLGLPISRHLAEAHGGKLWLISELNVGSTFNVTLPIGLQDPATAQS